MRHLSSRLRLRRAGRAQEISAVRALLESRGFMVSRQVESFLSEFNGRTIRFTRNGHPDSIAFNAERANGAADPEWIAYYEGRTRTRLVPIGLANHEHLTLLQASEGGFYGAFDEFLCALGSDVAEMLDNLLNQDREPLA